MTRQPVGCAHISDLAEIIYYLGISKAQRRKCITFPPDASVRQKRHISTGQRSVVEQERLEDDGIGDELMEMQEILWPIKRLWSNDFAIDMLFE